MPAVESTADIVAIVGAATTFLVTCFGVMRLSRCTEITVCGMRIVRSVVEPKPPPPERDSPSSPQSPRGMVQV